MPKPQIASLTKKRQVDLTVGASGNLSESTPVNKKRHVILVHSTTLALYHPNESSFTLSDAHTWTHTHGHTHIQT